MPARPTVRDSFAACPRSLVQRRLYVDLHGLRPLRFVALAVAVAGAPGCSKPGDATLTADPAATTSAEPAGPDAPAARSEPAPAAVPSGGASAGSSERSIPSHRDHLATSSVSPTPATPAEHPLERWMRGPATTALASGDLEAIAGTFDQMATWAPKDYPNWSSIAVDGAAAARSGSLEAVKAACRVCHSQYEARYKAQLSTRPLP